MGFIRGVAAGIAVATGAAAWYMSKAGERFRKQSRLDRRLGELGDEIDERTRDVRATVNAKLTEARVKTAESDAPAPKAAARLEDAEASAAEAAAELAASVEAQAAKVRKQASKSAAD